METTKTDYWDHIFTKEELKKFAVKVWRMERQRIKDMLIEHGEHTAADLIDTMEQLEGK